MCLFLWSLVCFNIELSRALKHIVVPAYFLLVWRMHVRDLLASHHVVSLSHTC